MMEVMVLGAFGAQLCQALKTLAAFGCDSSHETPNTSTSLRGKMRNTNWVAIPKLPPPPPLQAQNRSGSEVAVASSVARLRIDQGDLLEIVASEAVRPGKQSISAPKRVPSNPDRRATTGRKRIPDVRELLINVVERTCSRGHKSLARVHRDFLQSPKVDYYVGRLRKSFVRMPSRPHREGQAVSADPIRHHGDRILRPA